MRTPVLVYWSIRSDFGGGMELRDPVDGQFHALGLPGARSDENALFHPFEVFGGSFELRHRAEVHVFGVDRLARVVASVFGEMDADVTLYHVADEDTTDDDIQTLLGGLADRLAEFGMDPSTIETRIDRDQNPLDAIVDVSDGFDTVVMGETDPSLATFVFGMPADQVANRFLGPVFVAQRERPSADEDE